MSLKTILIVDDDPTNLIMLNEILKSDYKVKTANNGLIALQIACKKPKPDLILLDILMPDLDGFEVLKNIKHNKVTKDIPVIFVTAKNKEEDEEKGLALGAVDYITKPLKPKITLARVKAQLALKQVQSFLSDQNAFLEIEITKRMEEKKVIFNQLMDAQKLEVMGRLAAGVAHEINTPMQYISNNLNFLAEMADEVLALIEQIKLIAASAPEKTKKTIDKAIKDADWDYLMVEQPQAIKQSAEGIQRVNDIILAMKTHSHPGDEEKNNLNINQIINTAITMTRHEWKYIAELTFDMDPSLPDIPLLGEEIGQVIINLIINAAHAIEDKHEANNLKEKGLISINASCSDEHIKISVSDSGTGMDENIKRQIFDYFYTTKEIGKGTGQGLAIAYNTVVKKHDGTLTCESELGVGTQFIICLPRT